MIKKTMKLFIIFLLFSILLGGCNAASDKEEPVITISVAGSLIPVMAELEEAFYDTDPGFTIRFNYGGSGSLKQQILQGAEVDLFLFASLQHTEDLQEQNLVHEELLVNLLGNRLMLITPKDQESVQDFEDLLKEDIRRMAIGEPDSVPAGAYAKESLIHYGVHDGIQGALIFGKDVRQILTWVETGNVDAGLVYESDALSSDKIHKVVLANEDSHTPILYPLGVLKDTEHMEEARILFEFLLEAKAKEIFESFGFTVNPNRQDVLR